MVLVVVVAGGNVVVDVPACVWDMVDVVVAGIMVSVVVVVVGVSG